MAKVRVSEEILNINTEHLSSTEGEGDTLLILDSSNIVESTISEVQP